MTNSKDVSQRIRHYFQAKARQLAAVAELSVCEHPGLIGSHREQLQRVYLSEILPKRFAVGHGMVYGPFHRSREADIVIWDSLNFPSLPISDHSFFFADSVKGILECKSQWSTEEFHDVLDKCRAARGISIMSARMTIVDEIDMLRQQIASLAGGGVHEGMLKAPHYIGMAAVFLTGGQTFSSKQITQDIADDIDEIWPDILLLLEPGMVVIKKYEATEGFGGRGWLEFYDLGKDALLVFTTSLLALITDRSVQVEDPLYISNYVRDVASISPSEIIDFRLTRPPAQTTHIWT